MTIFMLLLSGESLLQAQYSANINKTEKREIPVKGVSNPTKGDLVMRSAPLQYIRAFISDKTISITVTEQMENVMLIIRNMDTV
ncbi:hypothetical protein DW228_18290 [Bacteroides fragilis]|uniref:Uncharacterized protein n=2 Tax=Bacteroides fragilis TaxID=817 RepID=A0A396BPG7_BACFG|nr:hypothetical protein DW228_18290 [Bacteroides fragilis]